MLPPNRNFLWTELLVAELIRGGLRYVCIAPGSRSTPLALTFYEHRDQIKLYSLIDERSAAYFALGLGLSTGSAAAVLCTSGTAAANFYPAIIEAYQSRVPLLVLTADRAHELRDSGANQTIDQVKMFGDNVLWAVDVALAESAPPPVLLRSLRTLAARALATANGPRKGPVHLNLPFRKPLEPIPAPADRTVMPALAEARTDGAPYSLIRAGVSDLPSEQAQSLAAVFNQHERGLILCGSGTPEAADEAIAALSRRTGYPVMVDALASLRFSPHNRDVQLISTHDSVMDALSDDTGALTSLNLTQPDVLIRFGNVPTSTVLITWSMGLQAQHVIHFNDVWADDSHHVSQLIQADPVGACQAITAHIAPRGLNEWQRAWQAVEQTAQNCIAAELPSDFFDGAVVADVVDRLPDGARLFIGNSLPVRHLDQFGATSAKRLHVYANRGASGIDGVISTALGVAATQTDQQPPLTLVIGDVSFYHDMNGLLAIKRCGIPITIVLINNDGGGIFKRLPIRDFDPAFTDLFLTQHGLDFENTARLYGLDYERVQTRADFQRVFAQPASHARLIEVCTEIEHDWARREAITQAVCDRIQHLEPIQGVNSQP